MKIKLIATDLDGTLLKQKRFISHTNINYLKKFIMRGGLVCFITGRSLESAKEVANLFEKKTGYKIQYISCFKGSVLYDNVKDMILYQNVIDPKLSKEIFNICKTNKCIFTAYLEKDTNNKNMVLFGSNWICNILHFFGIFRNYKKIQTWDNKNGTNKINIVNFFSQRKLRNSMHEINDKLNNSIDISLTSLFLYEITKKGMNKGYSLQEISKLLNINLNEIAVFGDSDNDIDMFKIAGLSIMIGNHCNQLKKYANYQIKTRRYSGVGTGIKRYILDSN